MTYSQKIKAKAAQVSLMGLLFVSTAATQSQAQEKKYYDGLTIGVEAGVSQFKGNRKFDQDRPFQYIVRSEPKEDFSYGLRIGFNKQFDNGWVLGLAAGHQFLGKDNALFDYDVNVDKRAGRIIDRRWQDIKSKTEVMGQLGHTFGKDERWLVYGEAGISFIRADERTLRYDFADQLLLDSGTESDKIYQALNVGVGVKYAITDRIRLGLRANQVNTFQDTSMRKMNQLMTTVNFAF